MGSFYRVSSTLGVGDWWDTGRSFGLKKFGIYGTNATYPPKKKKKIQVKIVICFVEGRENSITVVNHESGQQ